MGSRVDAYRWIHGHLRNPVSVCATESDTTCVPLTGVERVEAAWGSTCAQVQASGDVMCWGDNWDAQLGTGDIGYELNPVPACASGTGATCQPMTGVALAKVASYYGCALISRRKKQLH